MVRMVFWNVRGACGRNFAQNIRLLCRRNYPDILLLAETKSESDDNFRCLMSMDFDGMSYVPSVGRSGGIVAIWITAKIDVTIVRQDRQFIHLRCSGVGTQSSYVTAVYALPCNSQKQILWTELGHMAFTMVEPWTLIGDFNDVAAAIERSGGSEANARRMTLFSDQIHQCHLLDLGAVGPRFTWRGPLLRGGRRLFERLDRGLANEVFFSSFPECTVQVLSRTKFSDHNPICLEYGVNAIPVCRNRCFRFEAMWIKHANYNEFLNHNWDNDKDLLFSLNLLQGSLLNWNKEVFGFIEKQKQNILNRIYEIQRSVGYPHSTYLCNLEMELHEELERLLKLEEIKWFQWVTNGDRNTHYYHLKAKMRKKRNRIVMLKNGNGEWVDREEDLRLLILNHFKSLFCADSHDPQ
ncbi:hypothetical protein QN277_029048 [Acacia crassicarpa]|uniref:Endonuclease/exonuclease/phosphatase domain-containing protein n=1 Tax=Acacia crassicarpa TaxID=499986 RepID=A0AAE1MFU1_9FABA|nr:hypothetical protein QN277_029048 [Acacia crassicarpa]